MKASHYGQTAKPTGNALHQIQECGCSTALHARAVVVSSRDAILSLYKIRRRNFPHLRLSQRSRDFLLYFDEQDPLHSLLFTFFSTPLRFISSSVFYQLHSFHLGFKPRIHSSTIPSLSI